jgi:hypothetical protein
MKILNLIHVMVAQAFYRWAMREINPMDPDLPRIMQWQSKRALPWCKYKQCRSLGGLWIFVQFFRKLRTEAAAGFQIDRNWLWLPNPSHHTPTSHHRTHAEPKAF